MRFIKIVEPDDGNTFEIKVTNTLRSLLKNNKDNPIVKLEIFVNSAHLEAFNDEHSYVQETIKAVFTNKIPAFSILYVPASDNLEFTVRYQTCDGNENVEFKTLLAHPYVTVKGETGMELFSGGISFKEDSLLFSAQRCFDMAEQILMAEDMNFGHIRRQWNYIPSAKQTAKGEHPIKDELTVFDEVKSFYYEEALFINGQPLNSNLHHFNDTLLIDFIAFAKWNV